MVKTFRNIIADIQTFCTNHNQIAEFGWGNLSNITTKEHDFTMLWLQPTQTTIDGHLMTLSFDMYVMDLIKQDSSNLLDVMNDTLLIGNDVINKFWDDEDTYDWTILENASAEPFEARFDDYLGGWVWSIDIEIENRMNSCAIPESLSVPPPPIIGYYIKQDDTEIEWSVNGVGINLISVADVAEVIQDTFVEDVYFRIGQPSLPTNQSSLDKITTSSYVEGRGTSIIEFLPEENLTTKNFGVVYKLTPYTSITTGDEYTIFGQQFATLDLRCADDLTTLFSKGDMIQLTLDDGSKIIDELKENISYALGTSIITPLAYWSINVASISKVLTIE